MALCLKNILKNLILVFEANNADSFYCPLFTNLRSLCADTRHLPPIQNPNIGTENKKKAQYVSKVLKKNPGPKCCEMNQFHGFFLRVQHFLNYYGKYSFFCELDLI